MEQTKEEIIKAAKMPISIVIVGLGNRNFEKMDELDADVQRIKGKFSGVECERDIVQFVEFRKYREQAGLLEEKTLEEVPAQFMQFMTEHRIKPKAINKALANKSPEARAKSYNPTRLSLPTSTKSESAYFKKKEQAMSNELLQMGFPPAAVNDLLCYQGLPAADKLMAIDIFISKGITVDRNKAAEIKEKVQETEEKERERFFQKGTCLLCKQGEATYAALNCKHVVLCNECADGGKGSVKTCPLCKAPVYKVVRVYRQSGE